MEECPKCKSASIKITFIPKNHKIYWSEHDNIHNLSKFTRNDTYFSSDRTDTEFLKYKCKRCGYLEAKNINNQKQK
jgi:predicted Zn-ribbon and HTH transcriptional regulator